MSNSTHKIAVRAVDNTAGAFNSIKAKAKATGASIRAALGGALTAAAAYMGFRAIKGTIDNLGKLSDISMKTGASVKDLTQSLTALQVMGLDLDINSLAKSFQYLNKNTGRKGMEGLKQTLLEISAIEDPAKRGAEIMKNFGRSGMEFAPIIEGGQEAVRAFTELSSIMPGVSDSAATTGDAVSDAMRMAGNSFTSMWTKAVAYVCNLFAEDFPGGIRAGALNAMNWLETFFKKCHAWIAKVGTEIMSFGALLGDVFTMGPKEAWKLYLMTNEAADADFDRRIKAADKARDEYRKLLKTIDVDKDANILGNGKKYRAGIEAAVMSKAIRNDLVIAGSNDAAKLAAFGPQFQSESKKQTALLERIAENTDSTAQSLENEQVTEKFSTE